MPPPRCNNEQKRRRQRQFVILMALVFCALQTHSGQGMPVFHSSFPIRDDEASREEQYRVAGPEQNGQDQKILVRRGGGKGMTRHLAAAAGAATLAVGTASMGVATYALRLHDWNKHNKDMKGGGGDDKQKKKTPPPIKVPSKGQAAAKGPHSPHSPDTPHIAVINNHLDHPTINIHRRSLSDLSQNLHKRRKVWKPRLQKRAGRSLRTKSSSGSNSFKSFKSFGAKDYYSSGKSSGSSGTKSQSSVRVPPRFKKSGSSSSSVQKHASAAPSRVTSSTSAAGVSRSILKDHIHEETPKTERKSELSPPFAPSQSQANPGSKFLGYNVSKHDKWAPLAEKVEDYGKVSAAVGAFTAGSISLYTAVKMHNHDAKEAKKD